MDMKAAYTSADTEAGEGLSVMMIQKLLVPTVSRVCNVKRGNPMSAYISNFFFYPGATREDLCGGIMPRSYCYWLCLALCTNIGIAITLISLMCRQSVRRLMDSSQSYLRTIPIVIFCSTFNSA